MVHKSEVESLEDDRLLYPSRLQGALTKVSNDRVNELIEYEYGWLKVLSEKLEILIINNRWTYECSGNLSSWIWFKAPWRYQAASWVKEI